MINHYYLCASEGRTTFQMKLNLPSFPDNPFVMSFEPPKAILEAYRAIENLEEKQQFMRKVFTAAFQEAFLGAIESAAASVKHG